MHIQQSFGTKGGACFVLGFNQHGIRIHPANPLAAQILKAEVKRVSLAFVNEERGSALHPFQLKLDGFDVSDTQLTSTQAQDVEAPVINESEAPFQPMPRPTIVHAAQILGEQAALAGWSKEQLLALRDAIVQISAEADKMIYEKLQVLRIQVDAARTQKADQLLTDAKTILDGLEVDNPHRHSTQGQSSADAVLIMLQTALQMHLSPEQIGLHQALSLRLRSFGREVQA